MRGTRNRTWGAGFTLTDTVIAAAIIALGVTSLIAVCGACTQAAESGRQLTQAVFLAENIREWSVMLPMTDPDEQDAGYPPGPDPYDTYGVPDDVDDLAYLTCDPPRDGQGQPMQGMAGWAQAITLTWLDKQTLEAVQPGGSDVVQVDVTISFEYEPVFTTGWLIIGR
jgi:Tfp pilus assembly protein PilV